MTAFEDDFLWGGSSQKIDAITVRDIEQMSYLGIQTYRFSLRWSDLFNHPDGWALYDSIIDACRHYGIEPILAIGEDDAGNEAFEQAVCQIFEHYQKQVKYWLIMPGYNQTVLTDQKLDQEFFTKNHQHFLEAIHRLRFP